MGKREIIPDQDPGESQKPASGFVSTSPASGSDLPTGTVTFLFTDIVGSTPLWERTPDLMAEALEVHNTALRGAIEVHGGIIFKTVGDAFQAVFPTALPALLAAIAGQKALQSAPWNELGELKVRIGLHTGEAELDPDGDEYVVSHTKNRIGRIHSAAHGGQILLSAETKELVDHHLSGDVTLKDLGEHRLKGMEWLEHLYQVCGSGLQEEFPPLATATNIPNNLPLQLTSFIGREKEIEAVCGLLSANRLVTLTGSGGTGKSRLSLQVATQIMEHYPNGVWFTELAGLADPNLVQRTLIGALGLQESPAQTPLEKLKFFLQAKNLLIILDNCEHVIADCARIAQALLQFCPGVKILATSREALGIPGEMTYPVPSLPMPDTRDLPALETLVNFPAVRLFVERASAVKPGFTVTEENAQAVVQICKRLDGIPLAIELAAARVNALSVQQITQRLDNRFRLLTGGSRTAVPRQQTLRASIDWSYSLLSEQERLLLMRLSVFQGGWTLDLAEEVCTFDGLNEFDVLDGLASLVSKSLLIAETGANGDTRYRRLETIRQYAREKLLDSGGSEAVYDRHLESFFKLAQKAEPHLRAYDQIEWLDRLELEMDNLRVALAWALEGDARKGMRLVLSLFWLLHIRGYRSEGSRWLQRLQEKIETGSKGDPDDLLLLAASRARQASMQQTMGSLSTRYIRMAKEALSMAEGLGEAGLPVQAMALMSLSLIANINDTESAKYQNSLKFLQVAETLGDRFAIAESLMALALSEPDLDKARMYTDRNLALRRELGDLDGVMSATAVGSLLHFWDGDMDQAYQGAEDALQLANKIGNRAFLLTLQSSLGKMYCSGGEVDKGIAYFLKNLDIAYDQGEVDWIIWELNALGCAYGLKKDQVKAIDYCQQAVYISQKNKLAYGEFTSCFNLAEVAYSLDQNELAVQYYRSLSEIRLSLDDLPEEGLLAYASGKIALIGQDFLGAGRLFQKALGIFVHEGNQYRMRFAFESLVVCAAQIGQLERVVCLYGYVASYSWRHFISQMNWFTAYKLDDLIASTIEALGEKKFTRLFEEGKAMSIDEAMVLVQEVLDV